MEDLELLSLLSFIYENRAHYVDTDQDMQDASEMLHKRGHMSSSVDTCKPMRIDTSKGDTDVLIHTMNKFQPQSPVTFNLAELRHMAIVGLLDIEGMSRYTYDKSFAGPMEFPRLHGGEVVVNGDVEIQSITDSVSISEFDSLMTSFVVINGTVLSCSADTLDALVRSLRRRIQLSCHDRMFGLLLVADSDHTLKYTREHTVRSWSIQCTASQGKLTLQVMNLLR